MKSLEDAWTWYTHSRTLLVLTRRLGARYWSGLDWDGPLGRDELFKDLEGDQIREMADLVLAEFDDLAIFVFFSVFESVVRQKVADDLQKVEEVSRVRRHRNWVAHGRKAKERPSPIDPKDAHDTLQAFLTHIRG